MRCGVPRHSADARGWRRRSKKNGSSKTQAPRVTFRDVAGVDAAKEELLEARARSHAVTLLKVLVHRLSDASAVFAVPTRACTAGGGVPA